MISSLLSLLVKIICITELFAYDFLSVDHLRDVASGRVMPTTTFDYGSDFDLEDEEEEEEEASKRSVSLFDECHFI